MIKRLSVILLGLFVSGALAAGSLSVATPPPSGFPSAPFSTTALTSWISTDSTSYVSQDAFNTTTISAVDDMSGYGNGWCQISKPSQPAIGGNGGMYFTASQYVTPCFLALDLLASSPQFTLGFTFTLDSGFAGATVRQLFDFPLGSAHQLQVLATSYKIEAYQRTAGAGTAHTVESTAITDTIKHTAIVTGDISVGTMTLYVDGASIGTTTWTGSATSFTTPPEIDIGNTVVGGYANSLTGQIIGFTAHNTMLSSGQISTLNTYLSGL